MSLSILKEPSCCNSPKVSSHKMNKIIDNHRSEYMKNKVKLDKKVIDSDEFTYI